MTEFFNNKEQRVRMKLGIYRRMWVVIAALVLMASCGSEAAVPATAPTTTAATSGPTVSTSRDALWGECPVGGGDCYRIKVSISGFAANATVQGFCFGGATVAGRQYPFTMQTDASGAGSTVLPEAACIAASQTVADIVVDGVRDSGAPW